MTRRLGRLSGKILLRWVHFLYTYLSCCNSPDSLEKSSNQAVLTRLSKKRKLTGEWGGRSRFQQQDSMCCLGPGLGDSGWERRPKEATVCLHDRVPGVQPRQKDQPHFQNEESLVPRPHYPAPCFPQGSRPGTAEGGDQHPRETGRPCRGAVQGTSGVTWHLLGELQRPPSPVTLSLHPPNPNPFFRGSVTD